MPIGSPHLHSAFARAGKNRGWEKASWVPRAHNVHTRAGSGWLGLRKKKSLAVETERGENVCGAKGMVLIEKDGTRKPICAMCRKAKEEPEPEPGYGFMCRACLKAVRERLKEQRKREAAI